ncbi:MAG: choice-of-anchor B family protein [Rubricoccaceae bacterium]|nr:choice-of-anchor B family protein [Rubricoccaceae bacterium]
MPFHSVLPLALLALCTGALAQTPCDGPAVDPVDGTLYPCENAALLGRLPLLDMGVALNGANPYRGNDIWGWTDPQTGQRYALVGNQSGTFFVDVTDPADLRPLGALLTETVPTTWRDIKTYASHAFIVADGAGDHGMQVFDLTRLRGLSADADRRFDADVVYYGSGSNTIDSAHNVAVNEDTGYAYIVGASDCAGGLHMVDIQDPTSPTFAGCFSADGYTHDVQCVVYSGPDDDYTGREICLAANEDDIAIVDVTVKSNPTLVAHAFYPNVAYAHQGWLDPSHRYFVSNDELDEISGFVPSTRTLLFDFADLDAPELRYEYFHPTQATDHNLYIRRNVVFETNDKAGLRLLRLGTEPALAPLATIGYLDTYPESDLNGFDGAWSVYPFFGDDTLPITSIVSDRTRGLFVVAGPFTTGAGDDVPLAADDPLGRDDPADAVRLSVAPNPFSVQTTLSVTVDASQSVRVTLYDALGRQVATPFAGLLPAGVPQAIRVDGADLPPGTYFVRVDGEGVSATRPLVRAR